MREETEREIISRQRTAGRREEAAGGSRESAGRSRNRSGSSRKPEAVPVKKENFVIQRDVQEVDVTPTLCHLYGMDMPEGVEGGVLYQALK